MRVAFLTPEYPTENPRDGGLASYLKRMAELLARLGHSPEVFVSAQAEGCGHVEGVLVHRVPPRAPRVASHTRLRTVVNERLSAACDLAAALEARHAEAPFQLVQSSDFNAAGLFVPRRAGRVHAIRCSWAADLYSRVDGDRPNYLFGAWERRAMRQADVVYAPSRFIADHLRRRHNIAASVVRPPMPLPSAERAFVTGLPPRYLIHFGQITPRKGSVFLGKTLPLVWKHAPNLTMVWCGVCWNEGILAGLRQLWGANADKVIYLGPVERHLLAPIVAAAEAAVLPSAVDNLPNTAIESLAAGIPVIGTAGASIDEIVENGATGHLVPFGDHQALAEAMLSTWTGRSPVRKGFAWRGRLSEDMRPETAVGRLLALGGLAEAGVVPGMTGG